MLDKTNRVKQKNLKAQSLHSISALMSLWLLTYFCGRFSWALEWALTFSGNR